jgi:bacterioferritin-associated ferredoxin
MAAESSCLLSIVVSSNSNLKKYPILVLRISKRRVREPLSGTSIGFTLGALMIICSCNVLTDSEISAALNSSACPRTPFAVYKCLGCGLNCGRCIATIRSIINEANAATATGGSSRKARETDASVLCPG